MNLFSVDVCGRDSNIVLKHKHENKDVRKRNKLLATFQKDFECSCATMFWVGILGDKLNEYFYRSIVENLQYSKLNLTLLNVRHEYTRVEVSMKIHQQPVIT